MVDSSSIYKVRRKDGAICFEGDLASLRAWLSDNRIQSDFEVKREGLSILQGDQLWSLVRERPELGYDITVERLRNERLKIWLQWGAAAAIATFLVGAFLAYTSYIAPAIDVDLARSRMAQSNEERLSLLRDKIDTAMKKLEGRIQATESGTAASMNTLSTRLDEVARTAAAQPPKIAELAGLSRSHADGLAKHDIRNGALESGKADASLSSSSSPAPRSSKKEGNAVDSALISVAWTDTAVRGFKFVQVTNKTTQPLTVSVTFTYGEGPMVSHVSIPPGRTYDSGREDDISSRVGGRRAFVSGNNVTFSFDRDISWAGRSPLVAVTPP